MDIRKRVLHLHNANDNKTTYTMTTLVNIFEIGTTYEMRFIGDNDLRPHFKCIGRTAKSAKFERVRGGVEVITRRIKSYDGSEYVLEGSYSMAPSINAKHKVTVTP